jgi:hypothetical protein
MTLEAVWQILAKGRWESNQALEKASGVDDDTLTRIINFLDRWKFVDIRQSPELMVKRKAYALSPVETFDLLRAIANRSSPPIPTTRPKIAERVACRACNGRALSFVGLNEVECNQCHEKQWHAIEAKEDGETLTDREGTRSPAPLGLQDRILVRLGHPQKAFDAHIPKSTQYFWFRCTRCKETSADYPHGHSKYLTCPLCHTKNQFWWT